MAAARLVRRSEADHQDSLAELRLLTETAGAYVVGEVTQSAARLNPATYFGSGKVAELAERVADLKAAVVVFDDDLSPVQIRNLEKVIGCKLLDRSGLILDIFARRAKTATAKTQVELAQLDYLRTRLTRQWTHLSRQQGGIGTRGPGETQIETDRRLIGQRMATLKRRLKRIDRQRAAQRQRRQGHHTVSLIGYTNAGKSTLLNSLAGSEVLAEDRLFATLDATTRAVSLAPGAEVLLSDTVGFIRKLPHKLIESFKSTLDEVRESDLLLHVVDASHARYEDHMQVVHETLEEINAADKETLVVFNKVDVLRFNGQSPPVTETYPDAIAVSALRGTGLDALRARLLQTLRGNEVERTVFIPVTEGKVLSQIYSMAEVMSQDAVMASRNGGAPEPATRVQFRAAGDDAAILQSVLAPFSDLAPLP